jgi:hypothetical protein
MHFVLPLPTRSFERRRRRLAVSIAGLIDEAEHPKRGFSAAIPVQREAILACRRQLLDTAQDLEATGEPVNVRGVELLEQLLSDGTSPVYAPLGKDALLAAIRHSSAALHLD